MSRPGRARNGGGQGPSALVPKNQVSDTRFGRSSLSRGIRDKTGTFSPVATIKPVSEPTQQPLEHQLEEIGTQLAWVRDYL